MALDPDRIAPVIAKIEAAFADVAYPGDDTMLHPKCFDDMDIEAFYGSGRWQDLPAETIARENASLSFASAAGFRFLLPAYMIWTLRNVESTSASVEHTIWSLDPDFANSGLGDFQRSKFALLSAGQRAAIIAFLRVFLDDPELCDDARSALENHWDQDR